MCVCVCVFSTSMNASMKLWSFLRILLAIICIKPGKLVTFALNAGLTFIFQ